MSLTVSLDSAILTPLLESAPRQRVHPGSCLASAPLQVGQGLHGIHHGMGCPLLHIGYQVNSIKQLLSGSNTTLFDPQLSM